ncbi:MAG: SurA N-terminal domain-containing protein [Desulfobacterales bacterium]|nr:SurA N-terminal domain-containing protein [Desulfobacterales bacterium]
MLSLMRKHAGTWMIKIILGAIVVVFVFWGVGSYTSRRSGQVASVNGTIITLDDYRITYGNLVEQVRQSFGNNLNEELIEMLQLRKRALDQLIDRSLMLQAAEKFKLTVSDEELSESIRNISTFQTAGAFDGRRYINTLNRNKITPETFEIQQRDAILIDKLQAFISGNIKVSDPEAQQSYIWNNTEVDIDYVILEPQQYKEIELTDEEIRNYFDQNKDSYKTDPRIKIRYLYFKPEDYAGKVTVSEDDIQDYYESNPEKFKSPKTVEARHILIKLGPDANAEEVESARQRIETVLEMAKEGRDFAELAKQYSEGPTKTQGGNLGAFRREAMVKPFADKAFSMKAGEISEPVRTRFGWHIIKVEKVNPEKTLTLSEAEGDILKNLKADFSKNLAYDEAEAVYDESFEGRNLDVIAEERNLKILTTEYFSQKNPPAEIKANPRFTSFAFSLPTNEISGVQDFGDGYYLIEVIDQVPAQISELETVEAKVKKDLVKEKQDTKARDEAQAFLAELKNGETFATLGEKFKLAPKKTGFFKRNDSIPAIGSERDLARIAFRLSDNNKLPEEVIKGQKGYFVISFRERQKPSLEGFEKEKTEIKERLLQQKTLKTFDAWLKQLKNESRITIEEGVSGT